MAASAALTDGAVRGAPWRVAAVACGALVLAWLAGFAWFVRVADSFPPLPAHADGIVALTGGADRVQAAVQLLAAGRADRLLISGVGGTADFAALAHAAGVAPPAGAQVTLGRAASSTHGNAVETAGWAAANHVGSLIVVTAGYHMPRALAELARAMPGVTLHAAPVRPPAMRRAPDLATLRLLAGEYVKWLAVHAGLSRLAA